MRQVALLSVLACVACAGSLYANTVVVTPNSMGNWSLFTTDNVNYGTPGGGSGTGTAAINSNQPDPNVLPDAGSVQLATGSNHGDESAQLRDSKDWVGTKLSSLTTLSYDTYATASNAPAGQVSQDTFFILYVNDSNAPGGVDRLFFEPIYSDGGDVTNPSGDEDVPTLNTWQNWNLLDGMWYSDAFGGPGAGALSWSQIMADEGSDATISDDTDHGLGGIRFTVGEGSPGDDFDVFMDNVSIGTSAGTTTYDFEPNATVPLPSAAWSGMALLGGLGLIGGLNRRRRQMI
jgi:hypothetical protein